MVSIAPSTRLVVTDSAVAFSLLVLIGAWIYNRRPGRSRIVQWSNLWTGVLSFLLGVMSIITGHAGRLWFPAISTSGWGARIFGTLLLIVAFISFSGSLQTRESSGKKTEKKL